jgi:flagellar biosynthesis protein FlhG
MVHAGRKNRQGRLGSWYPNGKSGFNMLAIHTLSSAGMQKIRIACAYLYSLELAQNDEFLTRLTVESLEQAFREKEKKYNPIFHPNEPNEMIEKRNERFLHIQESFAVLKSYLVKESTPATPAPNPSRPVIIAIGGAKGGIGKSIFSANLGVFLSQQGAKTVLVDLDLGGANLHLYLGETALPGDIQDFLLQKVPRLEDVMVGTKFGPGIIGGNSSRLGAANIPFALKM